MQAENKLKEYRTLQRISLAELYAKSGVSSNTIVMIESHKHLPRPQTRRKLAEALGVDEAILFPEVD